MEWCLYLHDMSSTKCWCFSWVGWLDAWLKLFWLQVLVFLCSLCNAFLIGCWRGIVWIGGDDPIKGLLLQNTSAIWQREEQKSRGLDGTWWALMKLFHRESNTNYLDLGHCLEDWWHKPMVRPQPHRSNPATGLARGRVLRRTGGGSKGLRWRCRWKTNPNRKIILKNRWVEFQKG